MSLLQSVEECFPCRTHPSNLSESQNSSFLYSFSAFSSVFQWQICKKVGILYYYLVNIMQRWNSKYKTIYKENIFLKMKETFLNNLLDKLLDKYSVILFHVTNKLLAVGMAWSTWQDHLHRVWHMCKMITVCWYWVVYAGF